MKASVIIPVFNAEKTIKSTLESLLSQSEKDFEVIIVDDHSTDSSMEICNKFCLADSRFKVITSRSKGAASARNTGILCAQGDFLLFADSDDIVDCDFISIPVSTGIEHGADVVWFNFSYVDMVSKAKTHTDHACRAEIVFIDYLTCYATNQTGSGCMWNKAYRRSFLSNHHLLVDESKVYGEDWEFNLRVALSSPKVFAIANDLYSYNQYPSGNVSKKYHTADFNSYCTNHQRIDNLVNEYGIDVPQIFRNNSFVYNICSLLYKLAQSPLNNNEKVIEYRRITHDRYFRQILDSTSINNPRLTLRQSITVFFIRLHMYGIAWQILKI